MPSNATILSDLVLRRAKPRSRPYRLADGRGLYLYVRPNGVKSWRFDYRHHGHRKRLTLGQYDTVGLQEARERLTAARKLLEAGTDPSKARQDEKRATRQAVRFDVAARDWLKSRKRAIGPSAYDRNVWIVEQELIPAIGSTLLPALKPTDLLPRLRAVVEAGTLEKAHRVRSVASQVLRYGVAHGWCDRDVTADLKGAVSSAPAVHFPSLTTPDDVGELLKAIDAIRWAPIVRAALKFAALVFVRPGELRHAEWAEIDKAAKLWRIPAGKMKRRQPHLVPLADQALAILDELAPLTGASRWIFPAVRTHARPMSDGTMVAALRRIGYSGELMTAHGFRTIARTLLAEQLHADPFVIEVQLAHAAPGPLGSAYNRALYLPQRHQMMDNWANYLDGLRASPR